MIKSTVITAENQESMSLSGQIDLLVNVRGDRVPGTPDVNTKKYAVCGRREMKTNCPKCGHVRTPKEDKEFPRYECPKCGIVYSKYIKNQPKTAARKTPKLANPKTTNAAETKNDDNLLKKKNEKIALAVAVILSLIIGYFAGREHIKYEMRQAMTEAANTFKQNMSEIFTPNSDKKPNTPKKQQVSPKDKFLQVSLIKKGYRDFDAEIGNKAVTFTLEFTNTLGKDMRAFDGVIIFTDLLDNPIKRLNLAYTKPINIYETVRWSGEMDYNQFMDSDRALRSKDLSDLNINLKLRKVLYADGSKEEF